MTKPPEIVKKISSGGVIYRISESRVDVVLVLVRGKKTWCLPKGLIDKNEDEPTAALREVREETGLTGKISDKIGHISYWFFIKDKSLKVHKTVHFYLLQYLGGSTDDHDHEVDEARWFPVDQAVEQLSFKSEKEIMQKAKLMIDKIVSSQQ
jgi:8-oxo-dGTP pyrophosphatase MutT (NUDIX family)